MSKLTPARRSRLRMLSKKVCGGCRQDRYNHLGMCERPEIDAPVTSDLCWNAEWCIKYNRKTKRYEGIGRS